MERSKFIINCLVAIPTFAFAKANISMPVKLAAFKVNSGEGRLHGHILLKGVNNNIIDVKISGKDTDGALAIFEQTGLSPKRGTPLHIHPFQDEVFKIIEGEYLFQVGDEKYRMVSGDTIFMPRNVPHAWTQVSEKSKTNVLVQPAGKLEEFFLHMAAFTEEPTKEQVIKAFLDHEMKVVGPPLKVD